MTVSTKSDSNGTTLVKCAIVFAILSVVGRLLHPLLYNVAFDMGASYIAFKSLDAVLYLLDFIIAIAVIKKLLPSLACLYIFAIVWFSYYSVFGEGSSLEYLVISIATYTVFGVIYFLIPSRKKGAMPSSKKTDGTYPSNF